MEASGVVLRQPVRYSNTCSFDLVKESRPSFSCVGVKQKNSSHGVLSCRFRDQGHLQYYNTNYGKLVCEKGVTKMLKMKKKQVKLVKGLRKDLLAFSEMGFGLDAAVNGLVDDVKGNMITEAAELLLEQLQKLKEEEKEIKMKKKEEKAKLKAARMSNDTIDTESSSCSSESSDSDCGQMVDMKSLKQQETKQIVTEQILEEATSPDVPVKPEINLSVVEVMPPQVEAFSASRTVPSFVKVDNTGCGDDVRESVYTATACSKKIEVCMGGKCKKSGGTAILEEFQRVLGIEGAVSGCKCMGKCKVGPNVKVLNGSDEDSVRTPANSLCVGVGLEDVSTIVANLLGDDQNQVGLAGAA